MTEIADIIEIIEEIENAYQSCQGLILSEDDLKCHIFRKLYDLITDHNIPTINQSITASPLHTEVPFYDKDGKLTIRPDITILDPSAMSIKHSCSMRENDNGLSYGKLPSKGYEFAGQTVIIEIKFAKSSKGISSSFEKSIRQDLEKIKSLQDRHNQYNKNEILAVMIVFNKTDLKSPSLELLFNEFRSDKLAIHYGTGKVAFNTNNRDV